MVLPTNLHAIEVAGVKKCALRIVHPGDLVTLFGSLGTSTHPVVKVSSDCSHLPVKFRAVRAIEDVFVHAEDHFVGPRVNLVKLDNMYERCDIRPCALGRITLSRMR